MITALLVAVAAPFLLAAAVAAVRLGRDVWERWHRPDFTRAYTDLDAAHRNRAARVRS